MIQDRAVWSPAIALTYLDALGKEVPDGWRLPGDDFHVLRDAYRQNYELCCQVLYLVVAARNTEDGREANEICSPDYSSGWVPEVSGNKKLPKTVSQFKKVPAEIKELYLEKFPSTQAAWESLFSRRVRNAIAHADADFVIGTGKIATGKDGELTYMDFVKSTVGHLQVLLLFIDFVKLCRIYGQSAVAAHVAAQSSES